MTFPILPSNTANTGYNLTRSLRFRASASAYLSRTPASAGNRDTWTWSAWVKRGALGTGQRLFSCSLTGSSDTSLGDFYFSAADKISFLQYDTVTTYTNLISTQVFRDPSSWYHIVLAYDDTQATAANRVKIYVNGVQITAFDTASYPTQNFVGFFNGALPHVIGKYAGSGGGNYYDGYLAEINFINAQALTPSSFGSTNSTTGVWQPARYTGTYGTNGFYLPFTDNSALTTSSNVGLGKDFSGNGNYWTTNNISITAGASYDSMTDVPTLTSATAANFAVLNPLDSAVPSGITDGNLRWYSATAAWRSARSTIAVKSGKWYWEVACSNVVSSTTYAMIGIDNFSVDILTGYPGSTTGSYGYFSNDGAKYNSASSAYGAAYTNDTIGIALDLDAGTLTFYKNGTSQGVAFTGISGTYTPTFGEYGSILNVNFGQRPFTYTPPTGHLPLNAYNLPDSTIKQGNKVMDAITWSGNSTSSRNITGLNFKPDFVWDKLRSAAFNHMLFDSVRGAGSGKDLSSDLTLAEGAKSEFGYLSSFNSNGFTVNVGTNPSFPYAAFNESGQTYVAWAWQAGQGSTSSNTSGTITSTVSVNASAGFSVVTYTGTGANATVGHGLGVAPALIIAKSRTATGNWQVYNSAISNMQSGYISLNLTNAFSTAANTIWGNTQPTSSVFTIGTDTNINANAITNIAYCWSEIAGYSKFGSYTGNASATAGTFVYLGFQPKFILIKASSGAANWVIHDTSRNTSNYVSADLYPNLSNAEDAGGAITVTSNGFQLSTTNGDLNGSGTAYIYAAFASTPFKNSLAF